MLLGPVGAVVLGVGLVLAVGYYSGLVGGAPADKKTDPGKVTVPGGDSAKGDPSKTSPPAQEQKPPAQEQKPPAQEQKPPAQEQKPPAQEQKPPAQEQKPPAQEQKPPAQEQKPPAPAPVDIATARTRIDRSGGAAQTMLATIYYADGLKNAESLQPVQIRLPLTASRIRITAEQVVNAPQDLKLYSGLPAGTKLLSVNLNTQTGVATVDLSAEAARVQGTAAVNNIQASFVYSLTEIPGVKAVQLWVLGRPAVLHGIEWSKPISRSDLEARNLFRLEPVIKFVP